MAMSRLVFSSAKSKNNKESKLFKNDFMEIENVL